MLIRTRITAVAVVVLLLVSTVLIGFGYRALNAAESRFIGEVLSGKQLLWQQVSARLQDTMAGYSKALTRDRVGLKALRSGDTAAVREQAATTHNMLSADGTLQRLQIFDTKGDYVASFPHASQGRTAKSLVHDVLGDPKTAYGINRDDDGSLQLATAFPLYSRGKLRGVAVYSQGIQRLLDTFQASDGSDVFIFDKTGRLEGSGSANALHEVRIPAAADADGGFEVVRDGDAYRAVVAVPVRNQHGATIARLVTSQDQTESYAVQATSTYTSIALVLVALIASAVGMFWYFRRTFRPIDEVVDYMTAISSGNLHVKIPETRRDDETGRLSAGLRDMVQQLRLLIGNITSVTATLVGSTNDLTTIADQGNVRIARQREETDQVATAATQMAATTQEVARSAAMAAQSARNAAGRTQYGCSVVDQTTDAIQSLVDDVEQARQVIDRLRAESENIGSVLDVIRGIAEQTNLLALNAAIEAARAGEQGRGFAVVADEVRTLASRTQQSTQDIQSMIENLQHGAAQAFSVMEHSHASSSSTLEHASSAHQALREITESVTEINAMNDQIASAAEEQSATSETISRSVSQIAALAEESLSAAEQTATSAAGLNATGDELTQVVERFEL